MKSILLIIGLTFATAVQSQTISPPVVELQARHNTVSGSFIVANQTLFPMAVAFEPFSLKPGIHPEFRKLDSSVHLELSSSSVRLGPKQALSISYRITSDSLPAYLTIYASFSGLRQREAPIVLKLPHTIWLCEKRGCRKEFFEQAEIKIK